MMTTTQQLLQILKKKEKEAIEYFGKISLGDKHEVKFGFNHSGVSISFLIIGESHSKNLSISEKLDILFATSPDLKKLDNYLEKITNPTKFKFLPYLKINKNSEPEMHAGMINVEHLRN